MMGKTISHYKIVSRLGEGRMGGRYIWQKGHTLRSGHDPELQQVRLFCERRPV